MKKKKEFLKNIEKWIDSKNPKHVSVASSGDILIIIIDKEIIEPKT